MKVRSIWLNEGGRVPTISMFYGLLIRMSL